MPRMSMSAGAKKAKGPAALARNRRATHDYQIHERFEAGLVLEGWEVKGIMAGQAQLVNSHVIIKNSEAWLLNCHIAPQSNVDSKNKGKAQPRKKDKADMGARKEKSGLFDPFRTRKLLLNAKEIRKLAGKVKQGGITIVVLDLHRTRGKIKTTIALAKGKKLHDKRRALKERTIRRDMMR